MIAALVTYARQPHLNPDDLPLLSELEQLGWQGRAVRWDDPATRWADFDAVVLRSCWDYHLRPVEFRRWLDTLEAGGVRLWNPVPVVRWNLDKGYLRDLVARDVAVPGTAWLEAGPAPDLRAILAEHGWARAVVKPRISAAGHETWVTEGARAGDDQARFAQLTAEGGVLVQEFVPEVVAAGELSLVYIGRSYSHAVRKRARDGDFRVQEQFGGTAEPTAATAAARAAADRALTAVPGPWIYARVDGVEREGRFLVMELEVIEPTLFLSWSPDAARRLARVIADLT